MGNPISNHSLILALSIVAPHGTNIANHLKTLEIRSWRPERLPLRNLLIVENDIFLTKEDQIDLNGRGVALIDIEEVHAWHPSEVQAACSTKWQPGFWAWSITNIRPIQPPINMIAKRKIYKIELSNETVESWNP